MRTLCAAFLAAVIICGLHTGFPAQQQTESRPGIYHDGWIDLNKNGRGFERVHLQPSETKTVNFTLKLDDLALWDRNMRFVVEPGKFKVMIGASSEDIRLTGEFEIQNDDGLKR